MAGLLGIIFRTGSIESEFRRMMRDGDAKFHTHPNVFPDRDISPQEAVETAGRDALAGHALEGHVCEYENGRLVRVDGVPAGKVVI